MSKRTDDRDNARVNAALLSIADRLEARDRDAVSRHQSARLARETRKPNPLLAELADASPPRDPATSPVDDEPQTAVAPPSATHVDTGQHGGDASQFRPLIDPALLVSKVWSWRYSIAGLTVAGFIVGCAIALTTPHRYTAYAQLLVDPREIKLVGRDIAPDFLPSEAALAIIDSQLELVSSTAVLGRVVDKLRLEQDPEFNGSDGAMGGVIASIQGFLSIFSGDDGVEDRRRTTFQELRDKTDANRRARTFVIYVSATTKDPDKSALIANEVSRAFIGEQQELQADSARAASSALGARLEALQNDVEQAESALEAYKASSGLIGPGGRLVTDDQLAAVTAQLAQARADTITSKSRAEAARSANVTSVIAGGLSQDLTTATLSALRAQHATQRQQVAALENALGSRHPKLSDAKASLQAVEADITAEVRRIIAGTQADLRRAVESEQALAASLAQLKAESVGNNDAQIRLRELERRLGAAREIYEAFLLRARETGELEAIDRTNIKVISPAESPESPSSMSRRVIAAGFAFGGFALGLGLAFFAALRDSFSAGPAGGSNRRQDEHPVEEGFPDSKAGSAPPHGAARAEHENDGVTGFAEAAEPTDPDETRTSEHDMHSYPPHYPYFAPTAPTAPQPQPQAQPVGWTYGPVPVAAHPVVQPSMPVHAPTAYPQPLQPAYVQPWPAAQPQYATAPVYPAPPVQPHPQAASQQPAPAAPFPVASPADQEELQDLRQSVREIRETVEALMHRRAERGRRVA
ncbi:Wzz/FepE/Etk N-terminal domain-containing protein [Oricola sp.]|uniref:Wzz/FepE/Etk N-terminal domain-containing protein n=1 Tax=Oricola sp. TaxID=1979950 RepID=UPI003BAA28ED